MDTIRIYVESLFERLPKTDEVMDIKEDMLSSMEDKYEALLHEGKSKNEAVGTVITEFGNIDELLETFGMSDTDENKRNNGKEPWGIEQVKLFMDEREKATKLISLGVVMCITAGNVLVFMSEDSDKMIIALIFAFILVATAIGIFIYSNSFTTKYEFNAKYMYLTQPAQVYVKNYEKEHKRQAILPTTIGVVMCVLSPLFVIIPGFNEAILDQYVNIFVSSLLLVVTIAVYLFIYFNNYKSGVDILLEQGEYSEANKKSERIIGAIASVYWPLVVAIFLGYSFITGDWGKSWIIWPVAGILFGAIAAFTAIITGNEDE